MSFYRSETIKKAVVHEDSKRAKDSNKTDTRKVSSDFITKCLKGSYGAQVSELVAGHAQ